MLSLLSLILVFFVSSRKYILMRLWSMFPSGLCFQYFIYQILFGHLCIFAVVLKSYAHFLFIFNLFNFLSFSVFCVIFPSCIVTPFTSLLLQICPLPLQHPPNKQNLKKLKETIKNLIMKAAVWHICSYFFSCQCSLRSLGLVWSLSQMSNGSLPALLTTSWLAHPHHHQ